jgi:hypothetical protein
LHQSFHTDLAAAQEQQPVDSLAAGQFGGCDLAFWTMMASLSSIANNRIHLGPLFVHAYGLTYLAALLVAVAIISRRWERAGGDRQLVQEVALWGFPASQRVSRGPSRPA